MYYIKYLRTKLIFRGTKHSGTYWEFIFLNKPEYLGLSWNIQSSACCLLHTIVSVKDRRRRIRATAYDQIALDILQSGVKLKSIISEMPVL